VRCAVAVFFVVGALGFIVSSSAVVFAPTSDLTRPLFWTGVLSVLLFFAVLSISALVLARLRGFSESERARARSLSLWGGPIGLFLLIWDLTSAKALAQWSDGQMQPPTE